jgi:hypothetical protein
MAINESRPLVGSSKNNKFGLVINSQANAKRLLSPPDIPFTSLSGIPINVFSHFFRFNYTNK